MDFPPFPPCFPRDFPAENLLFHVSFWSFPRRVLKSAWKVLKTARFFHEKEEFSAARGRGKKSSPTGGRAAARQRCREPDRKRADVKDLAVVLHLLAGRQHILHGGVGVSTLGKLHLHLLGHEADSRLFHTGNGVGSVLHLLGAVCAVHFDLVGLFHRRYQPFCFCAGRGPENHSSIWSIPRERMLRTWSSSSA